MALTRRIARPMLASMFIAGGIDSLRDPASKAEAAQAVAVPLCRQIPALPADPELLVRINGGVQVGAGVLLAIGRFRRLASLALIASIIPTTYAGHRFWEEEDDATRAQQRAHFLKNVGLLGGLILAATDTEGAPSRGWRARRRAAAIGSVMAAGASSARGTGASAADAATTLARHAQGAAAEVGHQLDVGAASASRQAQAVAARAAKQATVTGRHLGHTFPETGQQLAGTLTQVGQRATDVVSQAARTGAGAVAPYLATSAGQVGDLAERAQDILER